MVVGGGDGGGGMAVLCDSIFLTRVEPYASLAVPSSHVHTTDFFVFPK